MNMKIKALASCELDQGGPGTCKTGLSILSTDDGIDKWEVYEQGKKLVLNGGFTHREYEEKMRLLIDTLEV